MSTPVGDIVSLQLQLDLLRKRVKDLEAENEKLLSQVANCGCRKIEQSMELKGGHNKPSKKKLIKKRPGHDSKTIIPHSTRYVALKVMYLGLRFYGFASEAHMDPTVESELFKALERTRLAVGDKKELQYSRCGRTDKGVSSVGQVVALLLRSNLEEADSNNNQKTGSEKYDGEIDYVRVLNRVLPDDIRILGWCSAPKNFNARFSCLSREYKYLFWKGNLNILTMGDGGRKFVGEHDFRNFCKMDAINVHNYRRRITSLEISPCKRFDDDQLWKIVIKGSAFLWHQVRSMVAVLFMIGQGHESPDVIDALLDIKRTPRKPQYAMASETPLILQSCDFEELRFTCSSEAGKALHVHLMNQWRSHQVKAAIYQEALLNCLPLMHDAGSIGDGMTGKAAHVPLISRPTEPSYDERRNKLNARSA